MAQVTDQQVGIGEAHGKNGQAEQEPFDRQPGVPSQGVQEEELIYLQVRSPIVSARPVDGHVVTVYVAPAFHPVWDRLPSRSPAIRLPVLRVMVLPGARPDKGAGSFPPAVLQPHHPNCRYNHVMQTSSDKPDRLYDGPPFMAALVQALGIIDLVVTPVGVLIVLGLRIGREQSLDGVFVAKLVGMFVAGVTVGGLLLGLGALIRYVHRIGFASFAFAGSGVPASHLELDVEQAGPMTESIALIEDHRPESLEAVDAKKMLALLREIRDLMLLRPEEREETRARLQANLQRQAAEEVIDAINLRQLGKARAMLRDAEARFGATLTLERLTERIREASSRREPLDYVHTKRLIEEAISSGRWTLAERYVHALYLNHPESARCRKLWDDTRRARLHAHVQSCVTEHHWDEALVGAREFLERFPGSIEAETLRSRIDTLKANAEIQQRKQYETRFKELVRTHRYTEALRLARHVIGQFPDSPQANALRQQIPMLEKRVGG